MTRADLPSADQLEEIFYAALSAGDARGVGAALRTLAVQDPRRAGLLYDAARAAVAIADTRPAATTSAWSWTPPPEPGIEVRRVRPVERYPGDNGIRYDRMADNSGWRLDMLGRKGEVIEWLQVVAGAGSVYGGRTLVDATGER